MATLELQVLDWGNEPPASLRLIYEEAFPIEERRPWEELFGTEPWEHITWLIALDTIPIGFAVGWELPSAHYFEYLVIDSSHRGQGLGSKVLEILSYKYDNEYPVVLECEPAGYTPMAERRLAFYARHGLHPLPFAYKQPPYGEDLPWVELHLLSNRAMDSCSYEQIRSEIHRLVYKVTE